MVTARRGAYHFAMIKNILRIALVSATATLAVLTGCNKSQPEIRYVAAPSAAPVPAAVVPVQPTVVVMADDYVYYPAHEVYYSSSHHVFVYREGSVWVSRTAPPRVSVDVLFASPSVRLDFHDAPERHHDTIIRTYPRNWSPPGRGRGNQDDRRDERKEKR